MAGETKEPFLFTEADVQKIFQNVQEGMNKSVNAIGWDIVATTLETLAQSILDASIETNSDAARQGAEAMRRQIVSSALATARNFRSRAE